MFRRVNRLLLKTGAEVLVGKLEQWNIKSVFGYPGGASLPFIDRLYNHSNINYYVNCNEQCVGHSAEAYSKYTGQTSVVISTSGPGITNLVTPIQDAHSDGVPMLVIGCQVAKPMIGTGAFQECNGVDILRPCTKASVRVNSVDRLSAILDQAFELTQTGRKGPVFIEIPKDIGSQLTDEKEAEGEQRVPPERVPPERVPPELAERIHAAERPIFFVGKGATNAEKEIRWISENFDIPVCSSLHGLGIMDETENELALGMVGMHGSVSANLAVSNADLVVGIGVRFDDRTVGTFDGYASKAREKWQKTNGQEGGIVHIDTSRHSFNKTIKPDITYLCDSQTFLREIVYTVADWPCTVGPWRKPWVEQILEWKQQYPFTYNQDEDNIKIQDVLVKLNQRLLDRDYLITTGIGNHQMMAAQYLKVKKPNTFITSGSLGTMGTGLPFAIGCAIANKDYNLNREIYLIDGDSSFNMSYNDLQMVKRHNLPIKIIIMNDNRQQMVHAWQEIFFENRCIGTTNYNPNYQCISQAFNIPYRKCSNPQDLNDSVNDLTSRRGPFIMEYTIEPTMCYPFVPPNRNLDQMILSDNDIEGNYDKSNVPS